MNTIDVAHHFAGGAYAKETRIPRGAVLTQHSHQHDHLAILAKGVARVLVGEGFEHYTAPACITLPAGRPHSVEAISDLVWFCLWATDDTDPATVDATIMKGA